MTTTTTTTAHAIRNIPDCAPCTAFAPAPVGPYRRGFEDRYYDNAWFCPYKPGSTDAREYAAGHVAAAKMERSATL
jgi:hypothetical protein